MSLQIVEMLIPNSNKFTRPGTKRNPKSITIHETANTNIRANALAHAKLQQNGNRRQASWNYSVDDEPEVYLSIPENEVTYHAGKAQGNRESISIEVCVNQDGDFKKAISNTIKLVRYLIDKYPSITEADVVQHHYWSGKDCPRFLRAGTKGINWNQFIEGVKSGKADVAKSTTPPKYKQTVGNFKVGQKVRVKNSATHYATGQKIPNWVKGKEYVIQQRGSNRVLLQEVNSWFNTKDIEVVGSSKPAPSKPTTPSKTQPSTVYTGTSVVDYLVSIKVDSSPQNRRKLAKEYGIKNYDLSAEKNLELLNAMRNGKSKPSSGGGDSGGTFQVGDKVAIKNSAKTYHTGESIPASFKGKTYTVQQVDSKRNRLLIKELFSWVRTEDVTGGKPVPKKRDYRVGDKVHLSSNATHYATGQRIPNQFKGKTYSIQQTKSDRVLLKELYSWVKKSDLR